MRDMLTVAKFKELPHLLILAFAFAWMIDPSLFIIRDTTGLSAIIHYPHLLMMIVVFLVVALLHKHITGIAKYPFLVLVLSISCVISFSLGWLVSVNNGTNSLTNASLFSPVLFGCLCFAALFQAVSLVFCLKALSSLPMIDCMLSLIEWQLFVSLLRGAATFLPDFLLSCCGPLIIALCFTRKPLRDSLTAARRPFISDDSLGINTDNRFLLRLMAMNALVIFTIQAIQGFSPEPVLDISYIGSIVAIAITLLAVLLNQKIIRIRQLYNASLLVMELGIMVFALGGSFAFRLSSVLLDAAYFAFSAFFFTVLANTCQRNQKDAVLVFAIAELIEQIAALSGNATALATGTGVHAFPLTFLAGLGAVAFVCFPREEDYRTSWGTHLSKKKFINPATYYATMSETCSSIAMQFSLSKREGDVLLLLAQKKTAQQISEELVVSLATAKTHIHNIYKKIGIHSKQELYAFVGLDDNSSISDVEETH